MHPASLWHTTTLVNANTYTLLTGVRVATLRSHSSAAGAPAAPVPRAAQPPRAHSVATTRGAAPARGRTLVAAQPESSSNSSYEADPSVIEEYNRRLAKAKVPSAAGSTRAASCSLTHSCIAQRDSAKMERLSKGKSVRGGRGDGAVAPTDLTPRSTSSGGGGGGGSSASPSRRGGGKKGRVKKKTDLGASKATFSTSFKPGQRYAPLGGAQPYGSPSFDSTFPRSLLHRLRVNRVSTRLRRT